MLELRGNYMLNLEFGPTNVGISFGNIKEFTIIQDMNKFLPSFRIKLMDAEGVATHVNPFDAAMSRVSVQFGKSAASTEQNQFDFMVYRRHPNAYFSTGVEFDIVGLLDMEALFAPQHTRDAASITELLTTIATELKCDKTDISAGINNDLLAIQPQWDNAMYLTWLKQNLGTDDNTGYHIFVKVVDDESTFVCKSSQELAKGSVKYNLVVNDEPMENYFPVFTYNIIDNYKVYGLFGAKEKTFQYFDYNTGELVDDTVGLDNYLSLTDYFAIDANDSVESSTPYFGRNNEFAQDFHGRALAGYHKRITGLVKMWVLTVGLPNAAPGDVVRLLFGQGVATGELFSFQYSGYWLIERVVHSFGETHRTKFLLTRNGLDTDKGTSLIPAVRRKG